jgi:hypothetical protein
MPEETSQLKVDKTNLLKAGTVPVIAAVIGGLLWLMGVFGGLLGVLFWVVSAFAGYWYVNIILKSGAKPPLAEVAVNGAILGAVVGLAYAVAAWVAIGIRFSRLIGPGYVWGFGAVIRSLFEGAIAGAIVSAAWYAYKSGIIKTK